MLIYCLITSLSLSRVVRATSTTVQGAFCSCSQLLTYEECNTGASTLGCLWNGNSCMETTCSSLSAAQCQNVFERCAIVSSLCIPFDGQCSKLSGSSAEACEQQNKICTWISGTTCSNANQISQCAQLEQSQCEQSFQTLCYWSGNKCQLLTSCSQLTTASSCAYAQAHNVCLWNGAQCISFDCDQFSADTCIYFPINPANMTQIEVCTSKPGSLCQTADLNSLPYDECFTYSQFTYHWNSNDPTQGECVVCQALAWTSLALALVMTAMML